MDFLLFWVFALAFSVCAAATTSDSEWVYEKGLETGCNSSAIQTACNCKYSIENCSTESKCKLVSV